MSWFKKAIGAVATGGLSLLAKPAEQAIKKISGASAAKDASEVLEKQAATSAAAFAPYQAAGQQALGRISDIMSGKTKVNLADMPGYTAGLEAGESAISREAAAQGRRGGGTLASLFGFGQQYAGKAFQDYMSLLQGIANIGVGATQQVVGQQQAGAQAKASGILGQQQAYTNLAGTVVGAVAGGPMGAAIGGKLSSLASGMFGGGAGSMTPAQSQQAFYSWGG